MKKENLKKKKKGKEKKKVEKVEINNELDSVAGETDRDTNIPETEKQIWNLIPNLWCLPVTLYSFSYL